jgi:hypothetical protein
MGKKLRMQSRPCTRARSNFNERQMLNRSAIAPSQNFDTPLFVNCAIAFLFGEVRAIAVTFDIIARLQFDSAPQGWLLRVAVPPGSTIQTRSFHSALEIAPTSIRSLSE